MAEQGNVALRVVDEETLGGLLAAAVADAAPEDVMPPVAGPPGWTSDRREAFLAWHRARGRAGLDGPAREATYAVVHDGAIVGSVRLARAGAPGELETGIWLGRSHRGRGIGTVALRLLRVEARRVGGRVLVADTTADNAPAVAALRRLGATLSRRPDGVAVSARLPLGE
ncbi:GNAT family N-acetyltransferase [Streptomyces millisiae]|uniref:GNAT family N-acetyltransferase n=1 Tax=Streptomyces millisiae TaxID=3075542 RepID=A0ABU2LQL3_9ACTN|nr:GNAT family N-acetyltransferase [Streptomyces sp. DSM 44918]MDT0319512.1 GNAT family N-acetyltransferase [Streptomyces sp. DSM 44918]